MLVNYFSEKVILEIINLLIVSLKSFYLQNPINSVIHLAGLKSVSDSIIDPLNYWDVNVNGTLNLLSVMKKIIVII